MEKKHELPEFQVILQNQANAKFFVASYGGPFQSPKGASTGQNYAKGSSFGSDGDETNPNDPVW